MMHQVNLDNNLQDNHNNLLHLLYYQNDLYYMMNI